MPTEPIGRIITLIAAHWKLPHSNLDSVDFFFSACKVLLE